MLLATILLWALNLSVTKYILSHGLLPLPYATVARALAGLTFVGLTLYAERTLRVQRRDLPLLAVAAGMLFLNQLSFVFAVDVTSASTIGLVLGAIPIFAGFLGLVLGTERPSPRFWAAAGISAVGVGLVAAGSGGGELAHDLGGIVLGLCTAATWAAYSVAVAPLMRTYSPSRMSAVVLPDGLGRAPARRAAADRRPGLEPRLGDLGTPRVRDARAARRDERALVPCDPPDRGEPRHPRREPAALRRGRARGRTALRVALVAAGGGRRALGVAILAVRRRAPAPRAA